MTQKCLYGNILRVCISVLSAPRYGKCQKCSKSTLWYNHILHAEIKSIQSTANLSRHYRKFALPKVNNRSTFKTQSAFLIAIEYHFHLWTGLQSLYGYGKGQKLI